MSLISFLLICANLAIAGESPKPNIHFWSKSFGGSKKDSLFQIVERSDGTFIAVGKSDSRDGDAKVKRGRGQDAWIVFLDAKGNLISSETWGGSKEDLFTSVANTSDGGFAVLGTTHSGDEDANQREGKDADIVLRKYAKSGNLEWQRFYGGTADDLGINLLALPDGGFLVAADSYSSDGVGRSNISDYSHHGLHGGHRDFLVLRLDKEGKTVWNRNFGGTNHEYISQVIATTDGNFAAVGRTESSDGNVSGFMGEYDGWLVKFNPAGHLLWEKVVGGEMWDWGSNAAATPEGGVLFSGYSFSWDGDGQGNKGDYDYQLVRFDANGKRLWSKMYGGTVDDFSQGLVTLPDGNYIVTGGSVSSSDDIAENRGSFDLWAIRVNDSGELLWSRSYGGTEYDIPSPGGSDYYMAAPGGAITLSNDGGIAMAGASRSSDGDLSSNKGGYDAWLMKFSPAEWKESGIAARGQINPLKKREPKVEPAPQYPPKMVWAKSIGGQKKDAPLDSPQALIRDGKEGFVFIASSESEDAGFKNRGGTDVLLVHTDSNGKVIWKKSYGGSARETGAAVAKAKSGYVFVATTESNDGQVKQNKGGSDIWVVKVDETGKLIWSKVLGGSRDETATTVVATSDGGYLVGGSAYSNDHDVNNHINGFDYWIVKLSSNGSIEWSGSYGGLSNDFLIQAIETPDSGFALIGRSESDTGAGVGNHGMYDYLFLRLDKKGNAIQQRNYGALDWEWGNSVAATRDGGFILNGYTYTFDDFENGQVKCNHGEMDFWVAKISTNGDLEWQQCLGRSNYQLGYGIIQTKDGGYAAVGGTASKDRQISQKRGGWDAWLVKLGASGKLEWESTFGGSAYDVGYALVEASNGDIVAIAESFSTDFDSSENHGDEDTLLVRFGAGVK